MATLTSVNSLELPALLIELIECKRWRPPADPTVFARLFDEYSGVAFYSAAQMQKETSSWCSLAPLGSMLRGTPDPRNPPGDIEPSLVVLIGDLGIGFDAPFALDYRTSRVNPRVIAYHWHEPWKNNRWVQIAPDFESFVDFLKL